MFIMYSGLGINENAQTSSINGFGGARFVERFAEKEGRVIIGDDHIIKKTPQQVLQTDIIANFIQHFKTGMVPQQDFIILCYAKNAKLDLGIRNYLFHSCGHMLKLIHAGLKVTICVPLLLYSTISKCDGSRFLGTCNTNK